ncbi:MAG: CBASS cGAMP-activated phospholipase [Pseudonocardiaceae bacterium]
MQILCLDGGGLKGLFSAAVLAEIESDHAVSVADHFDLIVGTSTGGLIALALGAGMSPAQVVDFYVTRGPSIFPRGWGRSLRQCVRSKHSSSPLRRALEEMLGDRLLGDSRKRLVIPAYSLDENDVYLFKTPHHPRFRRDGRELMVDVALATTAAPTFLPAARLRNHRLVDGGVWANNPTLVGVVEALTVLGAVPSECGLLSLGTTEPVSRAGRRLDRGGLLQWARPSARLFLRAQAVSSLHMAEHLLGRERVARIDPVVPDGLFRLDRLDAGSIRGLAEGVSRRTSEQVEPFLANRASEFLPNQAWS